MHLDGHLVCQFSNDLSLWPGPAAEKPLVPGQGNWAYETPVPWPGTPSTIRERKPYFLRATFVGGGSSLPLFNLSYAELQEGGDNDKYRQTAAAIAPVPASVFSSVLQPAQMTWLDMAGKLTDGVWGT